MKFSTKCIQAGYTPKNGEPRVLPIVQSTTFKYESSEQMGKLFDLEESGYFYTRLANPTCDAVAAKIAALEGGVGAMLTSSGQAASFYAIFNIAGAGDHVVAASAIYGGTFNLFSVTLKKLGIETTFVHPDASIEEINAAFRPNTKAVFAESLSNPALIVLDFEKFSNAAHSHGVPLIIDNTFPTPMNLRPFEHGADIVVHSTTKYMDGHACALGGVVVDGGKFDWMANADKFPGLTTPDDSYHGLTYAKDFAKAGADIRYYNYQLFKRQPKERAKLFAMTMSGLRYFFDNRFALIVITQENMQKCNADNGMTEGFVEFPLNIDGVEVAASIMEVKPRNYKISLRSKEYADVNKIAGTFGGGGHVRAAGCMLFGEVEEVIDRLSYAVSQYLND